MTVNPELSQDVWKDAGQNVLFTTLKLNREDAKKEREVIMEFADRYQAILRSLKIRAAEANFRAALGFSNEAWDYLFPGAKKPKELETFETLVGETDDAIMPAVSADLFFHLRASDAAVLYEAQSLFREFLKDITTVVDETKGFRYFEGRAIIGFIDGTEVPIVEEAAQSALIGDEDPDFINGSYAFAQKWHHDMDKWNGLMTEVQEKAVGRKKFNDLELPDDEKFANAHNVVSKVEVDGEEKAIIRMNVPFSNPASGDTGTFFIGYSSSWYVTKQMLEQMVEKNDFLLTFSNISMSQLFFVPSRAVLDEIAEGNFNI